MYVKHLLTCEQTCSTIKMDNHPEGLHLKNSNAELHDSAVSVHIRLYFT